MSSFMRHYNFYVLFTCIYNNYMPCTFSLDYPVLSCASSPSIWGHKQVSSLDSLPFFIQASSLAALSTTQIQLHFLYWQLADLTSLLQDWLLFKLKSWPVFPASPSGCLAVRSSSVCIKQSWWTFPHKPCLLSPPPPFSITVDNIIILPVSHAPT